MRPACRCSNIDQFSYRRAAGTDVPSVRAFCEGTKRPVIRINPRAPQLGKTKGIGLATGALEALRQIHVALESDGFFGQA